MTSGIECVTHIHARHNLWIFQFWSPQLLSFFTSHNNYGKDWTNSVWKWVAIGSSHFVEYLQFVSSISFLPYLPNFKFLIKKTQNLPQIHCWQVSLVNSPLFLLLYWNVNTFRVHNVKFPSDSTLEEYKLWCFWSCISIPCYNFANIVAPSGLIVLFW